MAAVYQYPNNATLIRIAQELIPSLTMADPVFGIFPITNRNSARLRWAIKDNFKGLMDLRGLGGEPIRIDRAGEKVYEALPGYFGNFGTIDETEMTTRGQFASGAPSAVPVPIGDLIAEIQEQLMVHQVNRLKQLCWSLALSGSLTLNLPNGGIGFTAAYNVTTFTANPLWTATTTATPLADLLSMQYTYGRGTSNAFDASATLWINSKTAAKLLANTNATDLGGKRVINNSTITSLAQINMFLLEQNAPQIKIWDDGYLDNSGAFQLFIPDSQGLLVGKRPNGETPGEFQMTLNANNPGMGPGPYTFVDDHTSGPTKTVPPRINVHSGFNGGPVVQRATQLIKLVVG